MNDITSDPRDRSSDLEGSVLKTHKKITLILALVVGAALAVPAVASAEPGLSPASVEAVIFPGQSFEVEKTVTTPEVPPEPEIYFLVDTTGSMGSVIASAKANINSIISDILAEAPAAEFGLGQYKDFPRDAFAFQHMVSIGGDVATAVGTLSAGGGYDGSEGQFFALDRIANTGVAGFTAGGSDIVVWIGDAPAHDPVCAAITSLGYDITEASVTTDLQAAGLTVVALSTTTGYAAGLNDNPTSSAGDYSAACGTPGGTAGQADRITAATGGDSLTNVAPENVAQAILDAIGAVSVEVSMTSNCEAPISTSFDPSTRTVVSGDDAVFTETISVAADAEGGTYECADWALIDGSPLRDAEGNIIYETKTIEVPDGFVTGGGNIVDGRGKNRTNLLTFGGNAGFLRDGTIVGHYSFNFHEDGVKFVTTEITALEFSDSGGDPAPPEADSDTATFTATAKGDLGDGWVDGCTLEVTLRDGGEPQDDAVVHFSASCPDWDGVGWADLTGGNIQVHDGYKG
jgi:hypothetical protein